MALVFQYGSNCDADRFEKRITGYGGVEDLGSAETVDEFEIAFDVWSQGNGCAASDLIPASGSGHSAWGVLYRITDAGLQRLRKIEGSRYIETRIRVCDKNGNEPEEDVVTFLVVNDARRQDLWTSHDYVNHIVSGLRAHGAPEQYVADVIATAIRTNVRATRRASAENRRIDTCCPRQDDPPLIAPDAFQKLEFFEYYLLEDYLFDAVSRTFQERGYLTPEEFFSIVIWKANRAKTKIKRKLTRNGKDLAEVIKSLTMQIHAAQDDESRLRLLLERWQLALPMATAILTVLYPDRFTVYDVRVRSQLRISDFARHKRQVERYFQEFLPAVRSTPRGWSLRDKDKFLWGKSFSQDLHKFLSKR